MTSFEENKKENFAEAELISRWDAFRAQYILTDEVRLRVAGLFSGPKYEKKFEEVSRRLHRRGKADLYLQELRQVFNEEDFRFYEDFLQKEKEGLRLRAKLMLESLRLVLGRPDGEWKQDHPEDHKKGQEVKRYFTALGNERLKLYLEEMSQEEEYKYRAWNLEPIIDMFQGRTPQEYKSYGPMEETRKRKFNRRYYDTFITVDDFNDPALYGKHLGGGLYFREDSHGWALEADSWVLDSLDETDQNFFKDNVMPKIVQKLKNLQSSEIQRT